MGWDSYDHYNNGYNEHGREPPRPTGYKTIFDRAEEFFYRHGKWHFFFGSYIILIALMVVLAIFVDFDTFMWSNYGENNAVWMLFKTNFLMLLGLFAVFFPYTVWWINKFLDVHGGEPTDFFYAVNFVISIFTIIMAFLLMYSILTSIINDSTLKYMVDNKFVCQFFYTVSETVINNAL